MTMQTGEHLAGIPKPGDVLVGKYRVERVLGIGGMGAVVAAMHLHLDEKVAIKFLHAGMAQNGEIVARFLREGKAVIKIRSEHAVKVHDVGTLESGAPYLVMEYLDGQDLSHVVQKQGALRVPDAVDLVLQACEAIAEAHTLGIVHRDLKPANLFLTSRADGSPSVKVLDFGISKANTPDGQDMGMTKTQAVMGSPRYMSPEQMRSTRNVDARTDIWALGAILYELLSGAPPFNGETMTELCAQILQDHATPLFQRRRDVPPALDAVIQRCLAKNADERWGNLAQLAGALADFASPTGRASAERIARVMQARGGGAVRAPVASGTQPPVGAMPMDPRVSSQPGVGSNPAMRPAAPMAQSGSGQVWGSTTGGASKKSGAGLVLLLGGAGALVVLAAIAVVAVVFVTRGKSEPPPAAAAAAASETPAAPPPATTTVAPTIPADTATTPDTASAAASTAPSASAAPTHTAVAGNGRPSIPGTSTGRPPPLPPQPPPPSTGTGGMFDGRK